MDFELEINESTERVTLRFSPRTESEVQHLKRAQGLLLANRFDVEIKDVRREYTEDYTRYLAGSWRDG